MDGWIILDKPAGISSRNAGGRLARMFGAKTFGHIGTLDPMASGLLPIALGHATKTIPYQKTDALKEYLFSVQFGILTDTLDITGTISKRDEKIPNAEEIMRAIEKLTGNISQVPPNYSAIHINGRRSYEMARQGKDFAVPARDVFIQSLKMTEFDALAATANFVVNCGTGTYVRSLGRDIAALCGTIGTVSMIRRTKTNGFDIKNSVSLDFLEDLFNNNKDIEKYLQKMDLGLEDMPVLNLSDDDTVLYKNGGFIKVPGNVVGGNARVFNGSVFCGIGIIEGEMLRPRRTIK